MGGFKKKRGVAELNIGIGAIEVAAKFIPLLVALLNATPEEKRRRLIRKVGRDLRRLNRLFAKEKLTPLQYEYLVLQLLKF